MWDGTVPVRAPCLKTEVNLVQKREKALLFLCPTGKQRKLEVAWKSGQLKSQRGTRKFPWPQDEFPADIQTKVTGYLQRNCSCLIVTRGSSQWNRKCFLGAFRALPGLPMSKDSFSIKLKEGTRLWLWLLHLTSRQVEIYSHLLTTSVSDTCWLDCQQPGSQASIALRHHLASASGEQRSIAHGCPGVEQFSQDLSIALTQGSRCTELPSCQWKQWNVSITFFCPMMILWM